MSWRVLKQLEQFGNLYLVLLCKEISRRHYEPESNEVYMVSLRLRERNVVVCKLDNWWTLRPTKCWPRGRKYTQW